MNIYIAADHRGFFLKQELKTWLGEMGYPVIDCGNTTQEPLDDYPDFVHELTSQMLRDPGSLGIAICGSGIGVSIAANRRHGIRAGLCLRVDQATHARQNDHINCLCLAANYSPLDEAKKIVSAFLTSIPNLEDKYIRRAKKVDQVA